VGNLLGIADDISFGSADKNMNQYRCETCKKPHKVPDGLSRNPHFFCCDKEMPYETAIVTMIRGCTSHSDYRNGLDLHRQSERNKMLDELIEWLTAEAYSRRNAVEDMTHGYHDAYESVLEKIEELRQKVGKL